MYGNCLWPPSVCSCVYVCVICLSLGSQSVDGDSNVWKGVAEISNAVGYFDQSLTSPYIEVLPSNAMLRKSKVGRVGTYFWLSAFLDSSCSIFLFWN